MSDHTLIPPEFYPGGSEADFNKLKNRITTLGAENERHGYEIETRDTCIQQLRDENTKLQEQVKVYREAIADYVLLLEDYYADEPEDHTGVVEFRKLQALNQDTEGEE